MSDYMIPSMINAASYHATVWMNRFSMNMMTNRCNSLYGLSFNPIRGIMNYHRIINSRFSVIPIDK